MKYLIPWSGGLDSTAMIHMLLKEGHSVDSYYVKITNNTEKAMAEQKAIKKMIPILETAGGYFRYHGVTLVAGTNATFIEGPSFVQVPFWIMGALYRPIAGCDRIAFGYVMNDDAISYLDDIKRIYKSYSALFDKMPELVFPIAKMKKEALYRSLPENIRKHVHYCEMPKGGKNCGACSPCKRYRFIGLFQSEEGEMIKEAAEEIVDALNAVSPKQRRQKKVLGARRAVKEKV